MWQSVVYGFDFGLGFSVAAVIVITIVASICGMLDTIRIWRDERRYRREQAKREQERLARLQK